MICLVKDARKWSGYFILFYFILVLFDESRPETSIYGTVSTVHSYNCSETYQAEKAYLLSLIRREGITYWQLSRCCGWAFFSTICQVRRGLVLQRNKRGSHLTHLKGLPSWALLPLNEYGGIWLWIKKRASTDHSFYLIDWLAENRPLGSQRFR